MLEGVWETWQAVLQDTESADLTIRAPGGAEVRAHSHVLRGASQVLAVMLSTETTGGQAGREAVNRVIEITDRIDEAGLRCFLTLVYTGTLPVEEEEEEEEEEDRCWWPPRSSPSSPLAMLAALDLAHRWQVLHVVEMLAYDLAAQVKEDYFDRLLETAISKDSPFRPSRPLTELRSVCREFAKHSVGVKEGFEAGKYSVRVMEELRDVFRTRRRKRTEADLRERPALKRRRKRTV
jgi:hypothetical protein